MSNRKFNTAGLVTTLPTDAAARKEIPLVSGLLDYFPAALAAVAHVSKVGNDQHNPGQPMHWARGKSTDHAECIVRHLVERGTSDKDGLRHSAKVAWRALALLQEELEASGAPFPRAARFSNAEPDDPNTPAGTAFDSPDSYCIECGALNGKHFLLCPELHRL